MQQLFKRHTGKTANNLETNLETHVYSAVFLFSIFTFLIQNLGLTQAKFNEQTMKHYRNQNQNGWKGGGGAVRLAFYCHLPLGKGDVKKLLMQNVNSLLLLYTRTHLFQKGCIR